MNLGLGSRMFSLLSDCFIFHTSIFVFHFISVQLECDHRQEASFRHKQCGTSCCVCVFLYMLLGEGQKKSVSEDISCWSSQLYRVVCIMSVSGLTKVGVQACVFVPKESSWTDTVFICVSVGTEEYVADTQPSMNEQNQSQCPVCIHSPLLI